MNGENSDKSAEGDLQVPEVYLSRADSCQWSNVGSVCCQVWICGGSVYFILYLYFVLCIRYSHQLNEVNLRSVVVRAFFRTNLGE